MANREKQSEKSPAAKPKQSSKRVDNLPKEELLRTPQERVLDLQKKIGNKATTRYLKSRPILRAGNGRILRTLDTHQIARPQVQRQVEPWKDKPSSRWAIRSLGGAEIAIGVGKLHLDFELKNRRSGEVYDAVYEGQVAGVAAGFSISMFPSWINFSTAGKVKPSELDGLGSNIRCLGFSLGIVSFSTASLKLPNVDTSPARIDIGGVNASFGISVSAFYSGGEFRVYKKPDRPTA